MNRRVSTPIRDGPYLIWTMNWKVANKVMDFKLRFSDVQRIRVGKGRRRQRHIGLETDATLRCVIGQQGVLNAATKSR